ncbi:hypothetical protein AB6G74_06005 [Staphylococcus ureilyticus]|uniref:hypothetical protein n=1 Tax=Staphylococcus ureilyticus TaxID=94138 RepID=UPI0034DD3D71
MVRQAFYLRRQNYKSSRECVDDFNKKKRCLLSPRDLISFEKGYSRLDDYSERKLAELFQVTQEELVHDDGENWKLLRLRYGSKYGV